MVFCRNLLIYLHAEARLLAMTALRRLVARATAFWCWATPRRLSRGSTDSRRSDRRRRLRSASLAREPYRSRGRRVARTRVERFSPAVACRVARSFDGSRCPGATGGRPESFTSAARTLAAGSRAPTWRRRTAHEALQVCGEYLQRVPDSAEGHFLLGVLHDALGHIDLAVSSFRKVLYLDPTHREACCIWR